MQLSPDKALEGQTPGGGHSKRSSPQIECNPRILRQSEKFPIGKKKRGDQEVVQLKETSSYDLSVEDTKEGFMTFYINPPTKPMHQYIQNQSTEKKCAKIRDSRKNVSNRGAGFEPKRGKPNGEANEMNGTRLRRGGRSGGTRVGRPNA